jgi:hypothetical protein
MDGEQDSQTLEEFLYEPVVAGDKIEMQLKVLVLSLAWWIGITVLFWQIFKRCNKAYIAYNDKGKEALYISYVVSFIHAIFAVVCSVLSMFVYCQVP